MYSQLVVERTLREYEKSGLGCAPRSIDESVTTAAKLQNLILPSGKPKRSWASDELAFMRSEGLLCRADFRYFAQRYGFWELDASVGGGTGAARFWPSQERALELISRREEEAWAEFSKHGFAAGILIVWHKTRQQGATALARLMNVHRMCFYKGTRAIAASLDGDKVHELYTRDKTAYDNLPFFLKPELDFDVKDQHFGFKGLKSRLTYQQANQQAGVGTSQQFDFSHMTEIALWPLAYRLQFDFLPAVPKSPRIFVGWESTANGKDGFWYDFTESVRRRETGFGDWIYSFTPWYMNSTKNRSIPPVDWRPNEVTTAHAALIERSSAEFTGGTTIHPAPENLYWWETEYELNRRMGTLHLFFSNYPATPEQSFQYSAGGAVPLECLEWMRAKADIEASMPYSVQWAQ